MVNRPTASKIPDRPAQGITGIPGIAEHHGILPEYSQSPHDGAAVHPQGGSHGGGRDGLAPIEERNEILPGNLSWTGHNDLNDASKKLSFKSMINLIRMRKLPCINPEFCIALCVK
jgi:hypothetical protein